MRTDTASDRSALDPRLNRGGQQQLHACAWASTNAAMARPPAAAIAGYVITATGCATTDPIEGWSYGYWLSGALAGDCRCDSQAPILSGTLDAGAAYAFQASNLPQDSSSLQRTRLVLSATDSEGDLVVIELKRGKTFREAVAKLLDHASWVRAITYGQVPQTSAQHCSVPVNAVLFQNPADSRRDCPMCTWLRDPMEIADRVYRGTKETWNGRDYYVSLG